MSAARATISTVLVVVAVLALAIAGYVAWGSRHPPVSAPDTTPRIWTPIVVTPEGNQMIQPNTLRMEFWTPSSKTKDYLAQDGGAIRERDKWEAIPSEDRVIEFGKVLRSDSSVLGYRRAEVWGHGRTVLKPGWWWTTTVTTNYSVDKLVRTYRDFWKSSNAVFIEVIDNQGDHGY